MPCNRRKRFKVRTNNGVSGTIEETGERETFAHPDPRDEYDFWLECSRTLYLLPLPFDARSKDEIVGQACNEDECAWWEKEQTERYERKVLNYVSECW